MYRNIKEYELRYTDVDAYDNLKLSALLSLLEESACLSADELGFGYDNIAPKNIGFIIANWYVKLNKRIKLGDKITVHTWPVRPKHLIFLRDFELFIDGEKVGVATARWCMIDTVSFALKPISELFDESRINSFNTARSTDFNKWKIQNIVNGKKIYSKLVTFSDYDHYFHVNNTKYADFLLDVFSVEELYGKVIDWVQISYVKQCKAGETIDFYLERDGEFEVIEGRVDGELRVQTRLKFNGI